VDGKHPTGDRVDRQDCAVYRGQLGLADLCSQLLLAFWRGGIGVDRSVDSSRLEFAPHLVSSACLFEKEFTSVRGRLEYWNSSRGCRSP
jgi:hypothetical protein